MTDEKTKIIVDRIKHKFILECENEACGAILVGDSPQEILNTFQHAGWQCLPNSGSIFCKACADAINSLENVLEKRRRF